MDIQWHGLSCVSFSGKNATVITDPFDAAQAGVKLTKKEADVVLACGDNEFQHAVGSYSKETRVFDWPGEYEAKNVIVQIIPAHDRPREKDENKEDEAKPVFIYAFNIDGFRICHLSNLGHKLTTDTLEAIGDIDILLVPIGGLNGFDASKAHEVVEQIEPRMVIPMYYNIPGVKMHLAELDPFLKEVGLHDVQAEKTLKLTAPSILAQDRTEFKILEPVLG